jgi:hypothetical protein
MWALICRYVAPARLANKFGLIRHQVPQHTNSFNSKGKGKGKGEDRPRSGYEGPEGV